MLPEHAFYFHIMDAKGNGIQHVSLEGIYMDGHRRLLPAVYTDNQGKAIIESFSNLLIGLFIDGQQVDERFYPGQLYGFQK